MTASAHDAAGLFAGRADDYAKARPSYPREAIDLVVRGVRSGGRAIDVGCGTGISTRLLAARGLHVTGLDPNAEMLDAARREPSPPGADSLDYALGDASLARLADASVDLVTCFQSFHWFDPSSVRRDFRRVLAPGGQVALVWNLREEGDPVAEGYARIVGVPPAESRFGLDAPDAPLYATDSADLVARPAFIQRERERFANPHWLDEHGLLARARSASYFPKDPTQAAEVTAALRELFAGHAVEREGRRMVRLGQSTLVSIAVPGAEA
ncbi:MAG: class I SAM-dependent methyltransferase [Phycisphaerales bacterium]